MTILARLLEKMGINDPANLSSEEKETLKQWQGVLSSGEVTVDTVKQFCENQIKRIESQWRNLDNPITKNERLIQQHTVYSTFLGLITVPRAEKEALETYLESMITK